MELIMIILIITIVFLLRHFLFGSKNLPPSPNIYHILSNISLLINKGPIAFNKLSKIYGPLISFKFGGHVFVVASSSALANEILKTNNRSCKGRFFPSVYYNIPGAANASISMSKDCDDSWKFLRTLIQQRFLSATAIESAANRRKSKVMEMVKLLSTQKIGQIVNIETIICAALTNIISDALVSRNLYNTGGDGEKDEIVRSFLDDVLRRTSIIGLSDVFPVMKRVDFWTRRRGFEIGLGVKHIWGDIVSERRRSRHVDPNSEKDFLDVLFGTEFSDEQIYVILSEQLLSSTDSTTTTAVWLITELIKNQDILRKVRMEIEENAVEGNSILNETLLFKCQYFHACIKETLRLHVPGPILVPRRAIETCKVNNYTIPKDTMIIVNAYSIQLDPNNWENPTCFKPERFINSTVEFSGNHFEYIPFSSGQRMCPGRYLAVTNVALMVGFLIHYFEWSLPNGLNLSEIDTTEKFGIVLKREKPLYLIPTPRYKI